MLLADAFNTLHLFRNSGITHGPPRVASCIVPPFDHEGCMKLKFNLLSMAAAAVFVAAPAAQAKPFKWASQGEISTWDIHSQNNALQNGLHANVYESLVYYNSKTFDVEPVLATAWKEISPTQIRFTLRQGVKFHDGSAFTADDAVYSIQRAMAKTSNFSPYVQGIDKVLKVDAQTIDVLLKAPNPVLLRQMTEIRDGHRRNANPDMVKVIKPYTNDQLVAISAYQSSLVMPGNMCKPKAGASTAPSGTSTTVASGGPSIARGGRCGPIASSPSPMTCRTRCAPTG